MPSFKSIIWILKIWPLFDLDLNKWPLKVYALSCWTKSVSLLVKQLWHVEILTFVWPLTLNSDHDLDNSSCNLKAVKIWTWMPSFKSVSECWNLTFIWPLTLNSDLDLDKSPCKLIGNQKLNMHAKFQVCIWTLKIWPLFDLWPWNSDLDLDYSPCNL